MLLLSMVAGWSFAQAPARTERLPQPPPPPDVLGDSDVEPQVTVIQNADGGFSEEVRVQGQLRYIRVTPRYGRSYYLLPDPKDTAYIRRDGIDPTVKVPMWVIFSW